MSRDTLKTEIGWKMRMLNVLFMQSQTFFGADSMIHSLLMRHLDRSRFKVHVAIDHSSTQTQSAAFRVLRDIPDISLRQTRFGPSISDRNRFDAVRDILTSTAAATVSLANLVAYCRRQRIDIILDPAVG